MYCDKKQQKILYKIGLVRNKFKITCSTANPYYTVL